MIKTVTIGGQEFTIRPLKRGERRKIQEHKEPLCQEADTVLAMILPSPEDQARLDELEQPQVLQLLREVLIITFSSPELEKNSSAPGPG
jgi:hypothetical protein